MFSRVTSGDYGGSDVGMWVGGSGAVFWAKYGCDPRSARYLTVRVVLSNVASSDHI